MADRSRIDTYLARLGVANPRAVPLGPAPWLTSAFLSEPAADFQANATGVRTNDFYTRYRNPTVRAFENAIAHLEGTEEAFASSSGMAALSIAPANPLLEITVLPASARACREAGVVSIVDSTIATPINQAPASHGIDLVVHSATKAIGGHGDFMGGVIAGSTRMIEQVWERAHILGSFMDPFTAWLGIRSLRTLSLRIGRLNSNALALAAALENHQRVRTVHYPGLGSHAGHAVASRQMKGYGSVLSIELDGGANAAEAVIGRFAGARRSASFGGPATLVVRPAAMWAGLSEQGAGRAPPGLLRIGVGLEEADTLVEEVLAALS